MAQFKPRFTDWELLDFICRGDGRTSKEICEHFGLTRQAVHFRLRRLVRRGLVLSEVGSGRRPTKYWARTNKPWEHKFDR
jgi:predicted ArsR family transcriptional regulator